MSVSTMFCIADEACDYLESALQEMRQARDMIRTEDDLDELTRPTHLAVRSLVRTAYNEIDNAGNAANMVWGEVDYDDPEPLDEEEEDEDD